jgi:RNA polymerase sigma factor (sigma-70 family)
MTIEERNGIIEKYIILADKLASFKSHLIPKNVTLDELKSAAYMGLIGAVSRFDPNRIASFEGYLKRKINWAMQDYLRFLGWRQDKQYFELEKVEEAIDVSENIAFSETVEKITIGLDTVAKNMVLLYYMEHKTLKEIASGYDLSISRVSQILKKARRTMETNLPEAA